MLHFLLCWEKVTGMPRIEIESESDKKFLMQLVIPEKLFWLAYMGENRRLTYWSNSFEPAHDKTIRMTCSPSEAHINLDIRPVWSKCSLCAATHWAHSKDWSEWANAQADMSLRWAHRSFCWFCRAAVHLLYFGLSHLRQQYWFLLFPETPRVSDCIYVSMHAYTCLCLLCHTADEL